MCISIYNRYSYGWICEGISTCIEVTNFKFQNLINLTVPNPDPKNSIWKHVQTRIELLMLQYLFCNIITTVKIINVFDQLWREVEYEWVAWGSLCAFIVAWNFKGVLPGERVTQKIGRLLRKCHSMCHDIVNQLYLWPNLGKLFQIAHQAKSN